MMQDAQYLDLTKAHAINDDKRCAGDHKLARAPETSGAPQGRVIFEIFHRLLHAPAGCGGGPRIFLGDVFAGVIQVS